MKQKNQYNLYRPIQLRRLRRRLVTSSLLGIMLSSLYVLLLVYAPTGYVPVSSAKTSHATQASSGTSNTQNSIRIDSLGINVPFSDGGEEALDGGAWWRYPERGNPEKGGNFILSAHRFEIGLTPQKTRKNSPFYHLGDIRLKDKITINYKGSDYIYQVTSAQEVANDAVWIERASDKPILTLYTCAMKGEDSGRLVIRAQPVY